MAQSFLNPASFAPKTPEFTGALGGILRMDQQNQFNQLMNDQLFLQKLGKEEAGIDLEEKKKDLPIKDLKRTNERLGLEAEQPYIAQLARGKAEDTLDEYGHKKRMRPLEFDRITQELAQGKKNFDWQNTVREAQLVTDLLPRAISLGPQEGAKWLAEQRAKYNKIGYNIPSDIDNPANWKQLLHGLTNSIPHMQKLAELRAADEGQIKAAEISAAAHRYSADQANNRARESERLTGSNAVFLAIRALNDPKTSPEKRKEAEQIISYAAAEKAAEGARKSASDFQNNPLNLPILRANPDAVNQVFRQKYKVLLNNAREQAGLPPIKDSGEPDPRTSSGQIRLPGEPRGQAQPAQAPIDDIVSRYTR